MRTRWDDWTDMTTDRYVHSGYFPVPLLQYNFPSLGWIKAVIFFFFFQFSVLIQDMGTFLQSYVTKSFEGI